MLKSENSRLELELGTVIEELKLHKDHNDLMHNEVSRLEITLKQSKQNHLEDSTYQKVLADTTQMYEKKIAELFEQLEDEHARAESALEQLSAVKKMFSDHQKSNQIQEQQEIDGLRMKLSDMCDLHEETVNDFESLRATNEELLAEMIQKELESDQLRMELQEMLQLHKKTMEEFQSLRGEKEEIYSSKIQVENEIGRLKTELDEMSKLHEKTVFELQLLKLENEDLLSEKAILNQEICTMRKKLSVEEKQREYLEDECSKMKSLVSENDGNSEAKKPYMNESIGRVSSGIGAPMSLHKAHQSKESISGQRATIAKIFEEVGLEKIVAMLRSDDLEVQIHAVKVVANLAAEDTNQEKIVEEGGIDALLMLLESAQNTTIQRVASGAIANLAMSEMNQVLIMSKGGAQLLSNIASKTDDPQTLRMVAGAFANLCGNQKLHIMLKEDDGIKALLGMAQSGNIDVIAQVARGMANFAKCESRGTINGHRKGRSLLIEDGALVWLVANSSINSSSTRRHVELALCHLAQNGDNARDFVSSGAVKELVRISRESSREDIRSLARKTLNLNSIFQAELQRYNYV